ncbi:hypothetical protein ACFV7R_29580 [Streptomyces sp. NPDC059866]|uniref:hypothetical protein n=1 Tax=Streptomyces sp. NPDC059866 TaxID=3346978 RepID=UPI00365D7BF2
MTDHFTGIADRLEELGRRIAAGESLDAIHRSELPTPWRPLLRLTALAGPFDATLHDAVLRPRAGDGAPTLSDLEAYGLLERVPGTERFVLREAHRAAYFSDWLSARPGGGPLTEMALVEGDLAAHWRGRAEPAEELRHLLIADPPGAATLFGDLFTRADAERDFARCRDLLDVLEDPDRRPMLSAELGRLRRDRSAYLRARDYWSADYARCARFMERPDSRQNVVRFLAGDGPRVWQLYGEGGIGKTIQLRWLVSRVCVPLPQDVPCARVDFDVIDPGNAMRWPELLLLEIADQLQLRLPEGHFASLRELARHRLLLHRRPVADSVLPDDEAVRQEIVRRFVSRLNALDQDRPVLVIVDTLEEPLLGDRQGTEAILRLLARVVRVCPSLRLILAGRYDLRERVSSEVLTEFSEDRRLSAQAFGPHHVKTYLDVVTEVLRIPLLGERLARSEPSALVKTPGPALLTRPSLPLQDLVTPKGAQWPPLKNLNPIDPWAAPDALDEVVSLLESVAEPRHRRHLLNEAARQAKDELRRPAKFTGEQVDVYIQTLHALIEQPDRRLHLFSAALARGGPSLRRKVERHTERQLAMYLETLQQLARTAPFDPDAPQEEAPEGIEHQELQRFTDEQGEAYLTEVRNITDPELCRTAIDRSHGLPLNLALFADAIEQDPGLTPADIRADSGPLLRYLIERVIRRIEDPMVRWVVRYGAVPRRLRFDDLEIMRDHLLRGMTEGDPGDDPRQDPHHLFGSADVFPFREGDLPEDWRIRLWRRLRAYAARNSWVYEQPEEQGVLHFHPDVLIPMRDLVRAQPVFRDLHETFVRRYDDLAARDEGQWTVHAREALYHRFQMADPSAPTRWRADLQRALSGGDLDTVKQLAGEILGPDYTALASDPGAALRLEAHQHIAHAAFRQTMREADPGRRWRHRADIRRHLNLAAETVGADHERLRGPRMLALRIVENGPHEFTPDQATALMRELTELSDTGSPRDRLDLLWAATEHLDEHDESASDAFREVCGLAEDLGEWEIAALAARSWARWADRARRDDEALAASARSTAAARRGGPAAHHVLLDHAALLLRRQRPSAALDALGDVAWNGTSARADALRLRVRAELACGNARLAGHLLLNEQAVERTPEEKAADDELLGDTLTALGEYARAVDAYDKACAVWRHLNAQEPYARLARLRAAAALRDTGDPEPAERLLPPPAPDGTRQGGETWLYEALFRLELAWRSPIGPTVPEGYPPLPDDPAAPLTTRVLSALYALGCANNVEPRSTAVRRLAYVLAQLTSPERALALLAPYSEHPALRMSRWWPAVRELCDPASTATGPDDPDARLHRTAFVTLDRTLSRPEGPPPADGPPETATAPDCVFADLPGERAIPVGGAASWQRVATDRWLADGSVTELGKIVSAALEEGTRRPSAIRIEAESPLIQALPWEEMWPADSTARPALVYRSMPGPARRKDVRRLQSGLNAFLGLSLVPDGLLGPLTRKALRLVAPYCPAEGTLADVSLRAALEEVTPPPTEILCVSGTPRFDPETRQPVLDVPGQGRITVDDLVAQVDSHPPGREPTVVLDASAGARADVRQITLARNLLAATVFARSQARLVVASGPLEDTETPRDFLTEVRSHPWHAVLRAWAQASSSPRRHGYRPALAVFAAPSALPCGLSKALR